MGKVEEEVNGWELKFGNEIQQDLPFCHFQL